MDDDKIRSPVPISIRYTSDRINIIDQSEICYKIKVISKIKHSVVFLFGYVKTKINYIFTRENPRMVRKESSE
jgi:hypothetical protein